MYTFVGSERQYLFNLIVKYLPMGVIAALFTTVGPMVSSGESEVSISLMFINMILYSGLPVLYFMFSLRQAQKRGLTHPVTVVLNDEGINFVDSKESRVIAWDQVKGINVKGYFHRVIEFSPDSDFFFDYYLLSPNQRQDLFDSVRKRLDRNFM